MAPAATQNQEQEAPPPCLQEILLNNDHQIPERYLNDLKNNNGSTMPVPLMDAPAVDMSLLASRSTDELAKLRSILTSWGCFQLVNHGMSTELLDQVRRLSKEFFRLPLEEKQKYARTASGIEGYGTDHVYAKHTINWNDRLHLIVYPEHQRLLQFWPLTPVNFREVIEEYTLKCQEVLKTLLMAMAAALSLEERTFLEQYGDEGLTFGRFNYYPPCPRPDAVLGIKAHTDGSAVTLLLQDAEVEALQVQKDDEWFRVPVLPHALFMNVGDQMEIMSNGLFKSAFHKVTTNEERDRISLAMLYCPHQDNEIGPASGLITEEKPQLFNKTKHYGQIYYQIDPTDNRRPIDILRI